MIPEEKVIVALDSQDEAKVSSLMTSLQGRRVWVKIGLELYYALGPKIVHSAKDKGFHVFLDLKLHDIPNTVASAMKSLSKVPYDMINVHATGGSEMMKRAAEVVKSTDRKIIAVTQLTSTSREMMNKEQRIEGDIVESVSHFARLSKECGLDGVVSSPLEVQAIKLICGARFLTVTPGIRPKDSAVNDQVRITTPMDAINLGVDLMVIGRPITAASDPLEALNKIIKG
jgi:orotidine-5'-phosphate decarboxylase